MILTYVDIFVAAQRTVMLLYFVDDFTIDKIATITQMPAGTVKSHLHGGKSY